MSRAIVLGAGMVGSVMAMDLADHPDFDVTVADVSEQSLQRCAKRTGGRIKTHRADLSNSAVVRELVKSYDICLGALSSTIGFSALRAVIEAGCNYCDICFMRENALDLDALAKQHDVTAVVDCGVAPGMSNLLAGYAVAQLDPCERIEIYVGGVPRDPKPPFLQKAAFAPYDIIEEYTRPARLVEEGKVVVREALSEQELMEFPHVGTLEAFNTDGLRSIAYTLNVPFMKEKTLRYPGHVDLMRGFREAGFFSHEPIKVGDVSIRPIDFLAALMFPKWRYESGEADVTVMRVIAHGRRNGIATQMSWDLYDEYDPPTDASSMARTTAFPCTIMARAIVSGRVSQRGVLPPELLGDDQQLVDHLFAELGKRGVVYESNITTQ